MSIKVSEITKLYREQKALDNVSFEIKQGEIVGLLGPNGAGKSTLMKIITCFLPPTSGKVLVYDKNIVENSIEVKKLIGYLPENNPLYTDMYVREFLEFVAGIHKISVDNKRHRVDEMIEITGLTAERKKKIAELSKGYRQRVGLAQALIHNPEVLILDEPTSGLDPNQIVEIRNLIKEIGKEKTVMLSTHIMQEVEAICQRSIIINKGQIVADGNTQKLTQESFNKVIIKLEFDKSVEREELLKIGGISVLRKVNETLWEIETNNKTDLRKEIFNFAVQNGLTVLTIKQEEQKLEAIFQQLTKM